MEDLENNIRPTMGGRGRNADQHDGHGVERGSTKLKSTYTKLEP